MYLLDGLMVGLDGFSVFPILMIWVSNFVFNFTLKNQIHSSGEYVNDRFIVVLMINKCMYSRKSD